MPPCFIAIFAAAAADILRQRQRYCRRYGRQPIDDFFRDAFRRHYAAATMWPIIFAA
jgi:hypothetical protein